MKVNGRMERDYLFPVMFRKLIVAEIMLHVGLNMSFYQRHEPIHPDSFIGYHHKRSMSESLESIVQGV